MSLSSEPRKLRHARSTDAITGHYRSVHVEGRRSNDQTHAPFLTRLKQDTVFHSHDTSAAYESCTPAFHESHPSIACSLGGSHISTQSLYSGSTGAATRVSVNEAFDDGVSDVTGSQLVAVDSA